MRTGGRGKERAQSKVSHPYPHLQPNWNNVLLIVRPHRQVQPERELDKHVRVRVRVCVHVPSSMPHTPVAATSFLALQHHLRCQFKQIYWAYMEHIVCDMYFRWSPCAVLQ